MHLKNVKLTRFKQFADGGIELKEGLSLVVGGNNSGKSSVLQALATWEFCKTILEIEKGRKAWVANSSIQGVGMGIVDFTPMNVPSLAHLWTNLKTQKIKKPVTSTQLADSKEPDGYTLKIKLTWVTENNVEKYLELGMSLANDRLFIKNTESSLSLDDVQDQHGNPIDKNVPRIAYLPPFAGVTDRETRLTPAMRSRLIGQGLSGGVIRNALFDLHETNRVERVRLREGRTKIKNTDLSNLRKTDPWELLQRAMQEIFGTELKIVPFNERYHSYLKVECVKGKIDLDSGRFDKFSNFSARDLMVEGSGFLQWLSVYALALSPDLDVILLDEPDAHLHPSLQHQLISELAKISQEKGKQILLATHSTELIRSYDHDRILSLSKGKGKYLSSDHLKIGVLAGIGAAHTPTLHALIQHKKMLIVEGVSDERFLRKLAERANLPWPKNLVVWLWTGKHSERYQLFRQLKKDIPELVALSIRDRDDEPDNSVDNSLVDKAFALKQDFIALKWRRRHIENYLLSPVVIARAAGITKAEVDKFYESHALSIPADITDSNVPMALKDAHGKELYNAGKNSVKGNFKVTRDDVAVTMEESEIADDIKTFLAVLNKMCDGHAKQKAVAIAVPSSKTEGGVSPILVEGVVKLSVLNPPNGNLGSTSSEQAMD